MQHISRCFISSVSRAHAVRRGIAARSLSTVAEKKGPKTLFISTVWPQKNASGGGLRTGSLIQVLLENGYDVECVSPSKPNEYKTLLNDLVPTRQCEANSSEFDTYLQQTKPELVVYDRYVMEEQFSWRVKKVIPEATHIVDTQDLHFLRVLRQEANTKGVPLKNIADIANPTLGNINAESSSPEGVFLREIASLYRSDGTILVSSAEALRLEQILGKQFVEEKVCLAPFFYPRAQQQFKKLEHFFMIGNFRHPPNMDAYKWVCKLWPFIHAKIPKAELHIYGAYPPQDVMNMTNSKKGFIVKGFLKEDQMYKLASYNVNFAPLRFGAGVKTKIVDGWAASVPCVTTSVGAEGMDDGKGFGGLIGNTDNEIVDAAVELYTDTQLRQTLSLRGIELVNNLYSQSVNEPRLLSFVEKTMRESAKRCETDVVGNMLWYHMNRSTEYFSKYLELKMSIKK